MSQRLNSLRICFQDPPHSELHEYQSEEKGQWEDL